MGMPGHLERYGILKLLPKREGIFRQVATNPAWSPAPDPQSEISGPLSELGPVRLETVTGAKER